MGRELGNTPPKAYLELFPRITSPERIHQYPSQILSPDQLEPGMELVRVHTYAGEYITNLTVVQVGMRIDPVTEEGIEDPEWAIFEQANADGEPFIHPRWLAEEGVIPYPDGRWNKENCLILPHTHWLKQIK